MQPIHVASAPRFRRLFAAPYWYDGRCGHRGFALVALVLLAACGGGGTEPEPSVAGRWTGSAAGGAFVLTLAQTGRTVSGSGTVESEGVQSFAVSGTVTGRGENAAVSLSFTGDQVFPMTYAGELASAARIVGTLTSDGGDRIALTFVKQ